MPDERRNPKDAGRPDAGAAAAENGPPYAAPGREPADQVAAQRISPSDAVGQRDVHDISSGDIVPGAPHGNDLPDDQDRTYGAGAELYGAYPNHNDVIAGSTKNYGDMETTFSKIGDETMPDSVQRDPAPASVGGLSIPVALLLALIVIAAIAYLVVAAF